MSTAEFDEDGQLDEELVDVAEVDLPDLQDLDDESDADDDDDDSDADDDEHEDDEDDEDEDEEGDSDEDDEDDADEDDADEDDADEAEESLDVLLAREKVLDDDLRVPDGSRDDLNVRPALVGAGEFTCRSCFLVKRRAQLADKKQLLCFDCA